MNGWRLIYTGYVPAQERLREALCTLGNGYFATRGSSPQALADEHHYPGTYIAGCYNRLRSRIAGREVENESLVNVPNWLPLNFRIDNDDWFDLGAVTLLSYRQELLIKEGELRRSIRFRDRGDRITRLEERRLVHFGLSHVAALQLQLVAENWTGTVEINSALDGSVTNSGVARYRKLGGQHLEALTAITLGRNVLFLKMRTVDSRIEIASAARTVIYQDAERLDLKPSIDRSTGRIGHRFTLSMQQNRPVTVEKTLAVYTSRDHAIYEPGLEAQRRTAETPPYPELYRTHRLVWDQLWRRFALDLTHVDRDEEHRTLRILRLHIFHLLQTTSMANIDMDVGIPARGLHGEAYRGHVFWDELFVFPMFNLRVPEITRALLVYRYRRLDEARRAAKADGHLGAMYPWQSSSNGREESQSLHLNPNSGRWLQDNSHLQRHINAAIAYNIWQYFQATLDEEFMAYYGAEMLLEIARFWGSIAVFEKARDRYEIRGVMGPDEYHDAYPESERGGLNNNAYTNLMAVWTLRCALELSSILPLQRWEELTTQLDIQRSELERWQDICRRMFVPFHDGNIISQFEGYDALEEFDWDGYRRRYGDVRRLDRILEAEGDSPNRYKASKQADVLMLFYLFSSEQLHALFSELGYPFEYETIPDNVDYYLKRTSHGSTLSQVVHSWVLARGDREQAWDVFCEALQSDVEDAQGGTTEEGIHVGAMAGTVDLVQRCFTGIEMRDGVLWLNPCLPKPLNCLQLQIQYRGHQLKLEIVDNIIQVSTAPGDRAPLPLGVHGKVHLISPGSLQDFRMAKGADFREA